MVNNYLNLAYLVMHLKYNGERMAKCKVSKFIKVPFIKVKQSKPPECQIDTNAPLPLYTIIRSKHQTIFYARNNVLYFYENLLSNDGKIIPFYDHKNESYRLTRLEYISTGHIHSIINNFKTPNGDTYFIYITKQKNISEREIVVYNHTKNKIIYRSYPEMLDIYTFKIPIANSLLVSLSLSGSYIWVRIIDMTREARDESDYIRSLRIALYGYFVNIADNMLSSTSKNDFKRLREIANDILDIPPQYVEYKSYDKIFIISSIHDDGTVFYKGFIIQFEKLIINGLKTKILIHKAFSLSFIFENNKMVVQVGTGEGG